MPLASQPLGYWGIESDQPMMNDMNMCGMNFDHEGTLIDVDDLRQQRINRGQCVSCGQALYKPGRFLGLKPLNVEGRVENGRCLVCHPKGGGPLGPADLTLSSPRHCSRSMTAGVRSSTPPTTSADRASRSKSYPHPYPPSPRNAQGHGHYSLPPGGTTGAYSNPMSPNQRYVVAQQAAERAHRGRNGLSESRRFLSASSIVQKGPNILESCTPNRRSWDGEYSQRDESQEVPENDHSIKVPAEETNHDEGEGVTDPVNHDSSKHVDNKNGLESPSDRRKLLHKLAMLKGGTTDKKDSDVAELNHIQGSLRLLSTTRSVRDIIAEMRESPDVPEIQRESCKAFGNLNLSEIDRIIVAEEGGLDLVIDAMTAHPGDVNVQECSCRALWNLSASDKNQKIIASIGGIEAIIQSMLGYPKEAKLQENAVAALSNLGAIEENQAVILRHGGIKAIVDAMITNLEDIPVQEKGCAAITNLSSKSKDIKEGIIGADGISAIVQAMMFHEGDPDLQEKAIRALRNMCANDDQSKTLVAKAEGVTYIISAMQNFRDHSAVQEQGCWTLSNLAVVAENKTFIGSNGGIDCIIVAMLNHSTVATVQEWGCKALMSLTVDVANREVVLDKGGILAVVNAMHSHQDMPAVQEKACGVFANLAANSDKNKERIAKEGGLDAIVMAMAIHTNQKLVQDRACSALRKLAYGSNIELMLAVEVPCLLRRAKLNFPKECGARADKVLRIMGEEESND